MVVKKKKSTFRAAGLNRQEIENQTAAILMPSYKSKGQSHLEYSTALVTLSQKGYCRAGKGSEGLDRNSLPREERLTHLGILD